LLYDLLSESYARSKLPLAHKSFFEAAVEQLPNASCRILIAYYQGAPIAGGCFLAYKNRVTCWYVGTKRIPGIAATSLVFWEAIKLYSSLGYEIFDFAGGGWEGEAYGPGKFKSKFGGETIHTGRYRKIFAPHRLRIAEMLFKTFRACIAP
jgi:lipid II:glycine glycyltransferase (peptidoglycan interpeptide bridge formation enzyme)